MDKRDNGYLPALKTTLRRTAAAYGYALTIGSTMAFLVSTQGSPGAGEVYLFALGGLAGFVAIEAVLEIFPAKSGEGAEVAFPFAGALNFFSVFLALGAVDALVHALHASVAWLLAPALATAIYMLVVAAQVAVAQRARGEDR